MAQIDQIGSGQFYGPSSMRSAIAPTADHTYHETDTGFVYAGTGTDWKRAWSPASLNANQPFPGFGLANAVTVPKTVWFRLIYGSCLLTPTAANAASLAFMVETTPGVFTQVGSLSVAAGPNPFSRSQMYFMICETGLRYYIQNGGLAGVTETIQDLNWADF